MKLVKSFAVALSLCLSLSSCLGDSDPQEPVIQLDLNNAIIDFNQAGYWNDCYNPAAGNIEYGVFSFSHSAWADVWDGVSYPAWKGFCPSKVNDNKDYQGDWTDHQWGCMPINPYGGVYIVGNSESAVSENELENNKCVLRMTTYGKFNPKYAYVTNSSYTYYCAKNGSAFNEAFTANDNFVLHIVGVKSGAVTAHLKYALISGGMFLDQWAYITLEPLGTVDEILFYVDSTAKNSYGLTVPAYFCITNFAYNLPSAEN